MNTTTDTRVPSPETAAAEAPPAQLPAVHRAEGSPIEYQEGILPVLPHAELKGHANIVAAIAEVMAKFKDGHGVTKGGENTFHNYKYARMQDILTTVTPWLGDAGLVIFQTEHHRQTFDDGAVLAIQYRFTIAHKSGEVWPEHPLQTGMSYCRFVGGKSAGKFDDKAMNKCHTAARKYFLMALLQIPTEDEEDGDSEKARRDAKPVPGPDGRVPPYRIEHNGSTFQKWADAYLTALRGAKSSAELSAWDAANDEPLGILSNEPKAAALYAQIQQEAERLMLKFTDPDAAAGAAKEGAARASPPPADDKVPSPNQRPDGCPDPERDPESFIVWAEKRMAKITTAAELDLIFENEIDPVADGMMPPDYAAVQNLYELNKKRLGGD
jgi:hypothetical protein